MSEVQQTDIVAAILTRAMVGFVQRKMYPAPLKSPLEIEMDHVNRRLEQLETYSHNPPVQQVHPIRTSSLGPQTLEPAGQGPEYSEDGEDDEEAHRKTLSAGCLPCARAHFATISGTLKEALRFAREDQGILHPEVTTRLQTAEEDINIIERHDWTPEKILESPPSQQEVMRYMLPKLRELRQDVMDIDSIDDLEKASAKAGHLAIDLRMQVLKSRGLDVDRVIKLAQRVENGEMDIEDARKEVVAMRESMGTVEDTEHTAEVAGVTA